MAPELKPIAENAKKFLEFKVIKAAYKGTRNEGIIKKIRKSLCSITPMLGFVDIAISVVSPDIDEKHEEILSRFDNIERILNVGFDTVQRQVVFDKFLPLLSSIKSEFEHFELIIQSYSNNEAEFSSKLERFFNKYTDEMYESKFVNQLTQTFAGMDSALNFLYDRALIDQKNVFNPKKTSPNQIMVDLFFSTVHMIYKGYGMLTVCCQLRDELRNQTSNRDQEFIKAKMDQDMKNLSKAFQDLKSIAKDDGLEANLNLSLNINDRKLNLNLPTYLYLGKIEVERNGYVITGVRFNEKESVKYESFLFWSHNLPVKIIYLQIQVGQLLPSGLINENSVYWQSPPSGMTIEDSVDLVCVRFIELRDLNFESSVLTGLKFSKTQSFFENFIEFKIYGRRYENKTLSYEVELEGSDKLSTVTARNDGFGGALDRDKINNAQEYVVSKEKKICYEENQVTLSNESTSLRSSFFDASRITLDTPVPLSGLGLLHYTNDKKHAGYIKPYLKTLHFKHIL